ncbi:hypothetical protein CRYUN_Cryun10bG0075100 [Craigia yunnanensis]
MTSSAGSRAWIVAASIEAVEALKDQGFSKWSHAMRSLNQHANNNVGSFSQSKKLYSSAIVSNKITDEKAKQAEESLRKVMYLSCWGPY